MYIRSVWIENQRKMKKKHKHDFVILRSGWAGSNAFSETEVSTFDRAVEVVCTECKEKRILK